jgi:hypothetical protein
VLTDKFMNIKLIIRATKSFYSGLIDSTSIIRKGDVPSYRLSTKKKFDRLDSRLRFLWLLLYIKNELILRRTSKIQINANALLYCGLTKNNLKQFNFFFEWNKHILSEYDAPSEFNNIAKGHLLKGKVRFRKTLPINIFFSTILITVFFFRVIKLNKTTLEYAVNYFRSYMMYFFYFMENRQILPRVMIFSNDHNPYYLGASRCAKAFGVQRVYIQHGGVSSIFPKLDFDVAVLFDNKSRDIYARLGHTTCKNLMIARPSELKKINTVVSRKVTSDEKNKRVIIFLTALPNIPKVLNCLNLLKKNPHVCEILIKCHPNFNDNYYFTEHAKLIDNFDTVAPDDICIIGNSTVTVDLAKYVTGSVYQNFDLDDIDKDYYGFVADGIAEELKSDELSDQFWTKSVPKNIDRKNQSLVQYCPIRAGTHERDLYELKNWINEKINIQHRKNETRQDYWNIQLFSKYEREFKSIKSLIGADEQQNNILIKELIHSGAMSFDEYLVLLTERR